MTAKTQKHLKPQPTAQIALRLFEDSRTIIMEVGRSIDMGFVINTASEYGTVNAIGSKPNSLTLHVSLLYDYEEVVKYMHKIPELYWEEMAERRVNGEFV